MAASCSPIRNGSRRLERMPAPVGAMIERGLAEACSLPPRGLQQLIWAQATSFGELERSV